MFKFALLTVIPSNTKYRPMIGNNEAATSITSLGKILQDAMQLICVVN